MNGEIKALATWLLSQGKIGSSGLRKLWEKYHDGLLGLFDAKQMSAARRLFSKIERVGVQTIGLGEERFPEGFVELKDPPFILFCRGNTQLLSRNMSGKKYVGIVGTRRISAYGQSITRMLLPKWASKKTVIVSGLAYGVDATALSLAIDRGFASVAIVPGGVDDGCPVGNEQLFESIVNSGGLIVAEFPPGVHPLKGMFPIRNRLIAALSQDIVVVESDIRGGAMITAKYGQKYNRKIWTIPNAINADNSSGPLSLIKKGACVVTGIPDLFELYGSPRELMSPQMEDTGKSSGSPNYGKRNIEKIDIDTLNDLDLIPYFEGETERYSPEEIVQKIVQKYSEKELLKIRQLLTKLELQGILRHYFDGRFSLLEGKK